MLTALKEA